MSALADIYMYVDETGNLDYDGEGKEGASTYFAFGSATFTGDHGGFLFQGHKLRAELEAEGIQLPEGFHAVQDKHYTRNKVFGLIKDQAPRFDSTFLYKANAYPNVRARGEMGLYKMAWYLHIKEIAMQVSTKNDTLHIVAGTIGTAKRQREARAALAEVCNELDRDIRLAMWKASTSWGLQVADYGLWAIQRKLEGRDCSWLEPCVVPSLRSQFMPWGRPKPVQALAA